MIVLKVKFPGVLSSLHIVLAWLITSPLSVSLGSLLTPLSPDPNHASGKKTPEFRVWGVIGRGQKNVCHSTYRFFLSNLDASSELLRSSTWHLEIQSSTGTCTVRKKGISFCPAAAGSGDFTLAKKWVAIMLNQTLRLQIKSYSRTGFLCGHLGRSSLGSHLFRGILHKINANVRSRRPNQVLHWQSRWQSQGILVNCLTDFSEKTLP